MFLRWSFTQTGLSQWGFARYVTKPHNALPWRKCHVYKYIISWRKHQACWGPDKKVNHFRQVGLEGKVKALQKQVLLGGYDPSWPSPRWIQIAIVPCKSSGKWYPGWQAAKVTRIPQGSANYCWLWTCPLAVLVVSACVNIFVALVNLEKMTFPWVWWEVKHLMLWSQIFCCLPQETKGKALRMAFSFFPLLGQM